MHGGLPRLLQRNGTATAPVLPEKQKQMLSPQHLYHPVKQKGVRKAPQKARASAWLPIVTKVKAARSRLPTTRAAPNTEL